MTEETIQSAAGRSSTPKAFRASAKSKPDTLRMLNSRSNGTKFAQSQKQLGWQPHSMRVAISRLRFSGLPIEFDQTDKIAAYRVVSGEDQ